MQYRLYYFLWIYFSNWQEYTNINCIMSYRYISQIGKKLRLMFEGSPAQDKNGCDPKLSNFGIGNDKTYRKEKKCNINCIISFRYIHKLARNYD